MSENRLFKSIRDIVTDFGLPRITIVLLLAGLFVAAPSVRVRIDVAVSEIVNRFGMNGVMVLAMVPMVRAGCGLNFGLPLGIIAGLWGATLSIEAGATGIVGFAFAIVSGVAFGAALGYGYAKLLNRVKGDEMMIAAFVGFSSVMFMNIMWSVLPFQSPTLIWGCAGTGLRTTISVEGFWLKILSDFLAVRIGPAFVLPTGMILFFAGSAALVRAFFRTKIGTALTAVGSNPACARASGLDVDRMRTLAVVLSTVLGAVGIVVYQQAFGFIQLYGAPLHLAFPAVAAILMGGAGINKANLVHVVVGTFLFQGILTMTPSVFNSVLGTDMSEVIRIIVANGVILLALTRKVKASK